MQTTRVVCTDYSWSLQKVLRTYKFKYAYLLRCLRVLTEVFPSYLLWWVRRTHFLLLLSKSPNGAILLHSPGRKPWVYCYRYIHWAPLGAAFPRRKTNARVIVPLLRSSFYFCPCIPRVSFRALPSFHPGLCRGVVPRALIMRLNFDAGCPVEMLVWNRGLVIMFYLCLI